MGLDELNQVRQCLYEANNQLSGKLLVSRDLMLGTLQDALDLVTEAILKEKHNGRQG